MTLFVYVQTRRVVYDFKDLETECGFAILLPCCLEMPIVVRTVVKALSVFLPTLFDVGRTADVLLSVLKIADHVDAASRRGSHIPLCPCYGLNASP